MLKSIAEKSIARYLIFGVPIASSFVWASGTTDPVNVTKLFIVGGVGGATGLLALTFFWGHIWKNFRNMAISVLVFQLAMVNALFFGQGPFLQSFYGAYGRQTGFVTYFFLSLILISSLTIENLYFSKNLIKGLLGVGALNIVYCGWVLAFGDFLPWNNVYRSILGLFGNPDFISAFLGIFIVVCASIVLDSETNIKTKSILGLTSSIAFYEILKSHAIQGIVVTAGGITLVIFFWIRSKFQSNLLPALYGLSASTFGVLAVLGTLQIGPFSFIYKRSVSLRGSYWRAGLGMGEKFPTSGVGLDGYGDFYRQTRPPAALIDTPGIQVVSNVSHNVFIDFFASGGWPLGISYILINIVVIRSIISHALRVRKYDFVFVSLATGWICYTVQSIISINQIGLAIWGWVFAGALLGYTRKSKDIVNSNALTNKGLKGNTKNPSQFSSIFTPQLIAGVGCLLGLIFCYPPLGSDIKWKSALDSRSLAMVEQSLDETFYNPVPSSRFTAVYQIFANSNLPEKALEYMRIAVRNNPNYFEGWRALYLMPASTQAEKNLAAKNLKRLDPRNPNVLSTTP